MKRTAATIASVGIFCLLCSALSAEPLTISYFERPPYYYTGSDGQAQGCLVERTREILDQAGLDARFIHLTPTQILYVTRYSRRAHCSIGWFKKPEREAFASFSLPIYRNRPMVVLSSKAHASTLAGYSEARNLFRDSKEVFGRLIAFSYGDYIDGLMQASGQTSYIKAQSQRQLLQAVLEGRATYMLVAPEEVAEMIRDAGFARTDFATHELADIPEGNLRYLMCNQQINRDVLRRINRAIEQRPAAPHLCD